MKEKQFYFELSIRLSIGFTVIVLNKQFICKQNFKHNMKFIC